MKIGIFGDSYATAIAGGSHHLDYDSWANIVGEKYSDFKNYAIAGSSLYYTYCQFLKHHNKFDKIIITITSWGRRYLPQASNNRLMHIPGITIIEHFKKMNISDEDRILMDSVYNYMINAQNNEEEKTYHQLMIDQIKSIRPDALLIPCFINEVSLISDYNINMREISLIDMKAANIDWDQLNMDPRHCHMNEENNLIFANKIIDWIDTNEFKFDSIDDFVISKNHYRITSMV